MKDIVDLDPNSAVTQFSFVEIPRANPQEELGIIDLENYISQAIWKLFDQSREVAAERLGIEEADLVLTDARVMGIRIDGHQVVNPQGFTGKKLEILLGITMVRRDKFVEDAQLFEGGSIRAYLLGKELGFSDALYVESGERATAVYSVTASGITHVSYFNWGASNVFDSVREALAVSPYAAEGIYVRHAHGKLSEHVAKRIDKIFYDSIADFVHGVTAGMKNTLDDRRSNLPPVYLRAFFPIPEGLHRKRFAYGTKRIRFQPPVGASSLEEFVNDDIHDIYNELNQLAKRRIKWLMPTG